MIWESKPWKDELLANARLLKSLQSKRRSGRRSLAIERTVFLSAYIMRKLYEAGKLSTSWKASRIPCVLHPLKGSVPDLLNWHRIDEHFDFDVSKSDSLTAIEFCQRLIHSYVFLEVEGPKKTIAGFFFASDHTKRRGLWFAELKDMLRLLDETGRDYPSSSHMVRDPKSGDWKVWAGHGDPPSEWTRGADSMAIEHAARLKSERKGAK
jgi:hypothetical protein